MRTGSKKVGSIGVLLLSACLVAAPASANPGPDALEFERVAVAVELVSIDEAQGARLATSLEQELAGALTQAGFEVATSEIEARFEVRVELLDAELSVYAISLAWVVGETREQLVEQLQCAACAEDRVLEETLAALPELAGYLPSAEPEPEPEPELEPEPCAPESDPLELEPVDAGGLKIGGLGLTGAIVLSAGLVTAGAGGLMSTLPDLDYKLDPRRVGDGFLALGATTAVLGTVLVVLDVAWVQKKKRNKNGVQLGADVAPTHAGLRVSGRF